MKSDIIDIAVIVHHRTEKAAMVSDDGDPERAVWLPLSKIEIGDDGGTHIVTLPEWLAMEKGLI